MDRALILAMADYARRAKEAALHTPGGVLLSSDRAGPLRAAARSHGVDVDTLERELGLAAKANETKSAATQQHTAALSEEMSHG